VSWLLVAVVALIGAGTPGASGAESAHGAGIVTAVSGAVTVTRLAATRRPVKVGDALYWGDVVETPKDGFTRLVLEGKTTVTVKELSRLKLQKEARVEGLRYTLELAWGKLQVSVARLLMRQGEDVEVRTRNAVASVRGTDFLVERRQGEETLVTTLSGVVEVSSRLSGTGNVELIRASETFRVRGTQDPVRLQP